MSRNRRSVKEEKKGRERERDSERESLRERERESLRESLRVRVRERESLREGDSERERDNEREERVCIVNIGTVSSAIQTVKNSSAILPFCNSIFRILRFYFLLAWTGSRFTIAYKEKSYIPCIVSRTSFIGHLLAILFQSSTTF
ncbi:hypothetical protein OCU04_006662 [Sclerotinia nivalis]|uniref:Uncharacterized protein n=1 Tax=Sclerotinia nivalis TaxID=352851 RepID=A0A9X0AK74_9HELO|nr:hypothetical protein OCU04_006662 [Sclerotinia nivalis]